jgi:hypothetical protein
MIRQSASGKRWPVWLGEVGAVIPAGYATRSSRASRQPDGAVWTNSNVATGFSPLRDIPSASVRRLAIAKAAVAMVKAEAERAAEPLARRVWRAIAGR